MKNPHTVKISTISVANKRSLDALRGAEPETYNSVRPQSRMNALSMGWARELTRK